MARSLRELNLTNSGGGLSPENSDKGTDRAVVLSWRSRMDREQIQNKLADLWKRHLPEIEERVGVLERACAALGAERLSEEERKAAMEAAHKLAGVLGTFGRTRGTELAREVEEMLEGGMDGFEKMQALVDELRQIIGEAEC